MEVTSAILNGELKSSAIPELWDGKAAQRITEVLRTLVSEKELYQLPVQKIPVA
jgi:hypothetical protein